MLNFNELSRRGAASRGVLAKSAVAVALLMLALIAAFGPDAGVVEGAPIVLTDEGGLNDQSGGSQKDLTRLTVDDAGLPTSVFVSWNWDDTGGGGGSLDGCVLFDSDGDGNANFSLCESATGDPGVESATTLYTCADTSSTRCFSAAAVSSPASDCSVAVSATDPFVGGAAYPNDLRATCTVVLADVGASKAQMLNVCAYPSSSPNASASDCVLVPRANPTATLTIKKVVTNDNGGSAGPSSFTITVTGTNVTPSAPFAGSSTGTSVILEAGNFSLSESGPSTYEFVSITGTGCPTALDQAVAITGGASVTCTITNSDKPAKLTVTKVVSGGGAAASDFTINVTGTNATPASFAGSASGTVVTLDAGSYSVSEPNPLNNYQASYSSGCSGTAAVGGTYTCTVTNTFQSAPGLTLDKSITSGDPYDGVGDTIAYSYLVTNSGNVTLAGPVTVSDDKATVSCPALTTVGNHDGNLDPTEAVTCTASYAVTQGDLNAGSVTNTATATAGGTESNEDTATAHATQISALALTKVGNPPSYSTVGETITYSYVIRNAGNIVLDGPFSVTDDSVSVTCTQPADGQLSPNETMSCTASHVTTQADLDAGSVKNTATATNGTVTSPAVIEIVEAIQDPKLFLTKTADPQIFSFVGDVVHYAYVVKNTGNVTLSGPFSVSDDKTTVTCTQPADGELSPGETLNCTASSTITQQDIDNGSLTNKATAASAPFTPAGNPGNSKPVASNQARASAQAVVPKLTITKSADPAQFSAVGQVITYTYVVKNTGALTANGPFTVNDDKTTVTCTQPADGMLSPGESMMCTAQYTIVLEDINRGWVTNTATATNGQITSPPVQKMIVFVDTTPPVVTWYLIEHLPTGDIPYVPGKWTKYEVSAFFTCSDAEPGGTGVVYTNYTIINFETDKVYDLGKYLEKLTPIRTCRDAAGNVASLPQDAYGVKINIDRNPPTCTIDPVLQSVPKDGTLTARSVTVTSKDGVYAGPTPILVKITADGAGSEYKGWDIGTADYSGKVRGTAGAIYTLTYRVTDLAGNTTTCKATIQTARY